MKTSSRPAQKMENLSQLNQVALIIRHAEQYYEAARFLAVKHFQFFPTFYLAHHAVELGLKAHLIILGARQKDIRAMNHDLLALSKDFQKRAEKQNYFYRLNPVHQRTITLEGGQYAKKCFEYPDPNLLPPPPIGVWLSISETIIREAKQVIN
jgi:HEPN domain-containing protein